MRVRRSHRVMAALAVASVALGACNLLTGLDADYSANAHDGAAAVGSEGGGDGGLGSDGQGGDVSTTDGSKTDAGDGGGVLSFCEARRGASAPGDFFCTDFDTESFPGNGTAPTPWLSLTNSLDAGTFAFVPDAGDGGSRVLDVMGVSTAAGGAHTLLKAAFSPTNPANTYQGYALEFEFRVLASNLDYDAFGLLVFKPNTQAGENGIAGYGPGTPHLLSHQGTGASPVKKVPNSIPTDWHLAKITLTRVDAGPAYTRTIKIDNTDVDDSTGIHTIDVGAPTELWMGIFNADNTPGTAHAQFDNVVLRRTQ
jgi:predicted small secreted protein